MRFQSQARETRTFIIRKIDIPVDRLMDSAEIQKQFAVFLPLGIFPFRKYPQIIIACKLKLDRIALIVRFFVVHPERNFHGHSQVMIQIMILIHIQILRRIIFMEREEADRLVIYQGAFVFPGCLCIGMFIERRRTGRWIIVEIIGIAVVVIITVTVLPEHASYIRIGNHSIAVISAVPACLRRIEQISEV